MYLKTALLGAVSLSLLPPAVAQTADDEEARQDTIVIEGSRLNQTATEVGSSVSVITADDIEQLGFDFAVDAIASAPGVTVNANGPFGGIATVRIRGAQNGQTLVLIDGVPVNDPSATSGGLDFARLDTENIAQIEVLKGPQSTLWGTDAIGGVVSITTKTPQDGLGGSAFAEYGSYNTVRGGASVEHANDQGDFRLAIVGTSSDGISKADENDGNTEEDGYDAVTVSAKGGLNLSDAVRLSTDLIWSDAESEFDTFGPVDGDNSNQTEELSANISLDAALLDGRFENLILVGYSDIDRGNFAGGTSTFRSGGDRFIYRYQGTFTVDARNKIAFGAEREETNANGEGATIDGLFALYEFKPIDTLTLTGGLRVDDHDSLGSETTGRVAAAYNPTDTLTVRASWGQGFKAPSIFQSTYICTFCGLTAPNTNLRPETSEAFDIGLDWRSADGRAEAGITLFDQESEDLIDFSFTAGYDNVDFVESQGVELYGSYALTDALTLSGSYAYIDAKDGSGVVRVRAPEHSGDITLAYDPKGPFSGAVLVRYNGDEPDDTNFDGVPDTTVENWTRVDLTGSYDLNDSVEVFGRIENLFDEEYQQILGYGTPDLSGSIGIRLRY